MVLEGHHSLITDVVITVMISSVFVGKTKRTYVITKNLPKFTYIYTWNQISIYKSDSPIFNTPTNLIPCVNTNSGLLCCLEYGPRSCNILLEHEGDLKLALTVSIWVCMFNNRK